VSKAKHLRHAAASVNKLIRDAVLAERNRCASICDNYAKRALSDGMLVHAQIAQDFAVAIRNSGE
jgi:hypothetical protein